jgi:hypothetical protein
MLAAFVAAVAQPAPVPAGITNSSAKLEQIIGAATTRDVTAFGAIIAQS